MRIVRSIVASCVALVMIGFVGVTPSTGTTAVSSPVDITQDHFANNEESLGMDPSGMLLAGAWNDWEYNDGCGFSYSTDGGATWAPESFVPGFTAFTNDPDVAGTGRFGIAGDPAVYWNPKFSTFDIVCQTFGSKTGNQIQLQATTFDPTKADRNADVNASYGAAAWTTPVPVTTGTSNGSQKGSNGKTPDHESITVDSVNGAGHHYGRLFVAWAEFSGAGRSPIDVAYSDDNGRTWTGPIRVSTAGHQFDQDARVTIGPDGELYMTWVESPNEKSLKNNTIDVATSTDGGATWSKTYVAATIGVPVPGVLPNSQYRVFEDVTASVDQATGALVVAFNDMKTGPSQMYATHTQNPGDLTSFTAPIAVGASGKEQFFPWMSAAPDGRVDLVYYDRYCDSADTNNCVVLASSSDAGATWTTTPVLTTGFDGDHFQACLAFVDPQPDCGVHFLGDYIAVSSTDSKAQVLYTGNGDNAMDAFSVSVTF